MTAQLTPRRRFLAVSCGIVLLRTRLLSAAAPTEPSGTIAFVRGNTLSSADRKIWLINPDGSDLRPLTESGDSAGEDCPAWSPDGKSIAFSVYKRIAVTDASGKEIDLLTDASIEAHDPCWSPDGKDIAFYVQDRKLESSQIYVMRADGSDVKQLTEGAGYNWSPSWSFDGKQIVFESTRDGNREIYSMSPDGRDIKNLTNHKSTDHSPACSPINMQIALMSGQDFGNAEVCVMNNDGTQLTNLTNHPLRDSEPAWSPDGKWLAFTRFDLTLEKSPMDIYVMTASGTQVTNVTRSEGPVHNWAPSWH